MAAQARTAHIKDVRRLEQMGVKPQLLSGIWAHLDAGVHQSANAARPISFATVPSLNAEL